MAKKQDLSDIIRDVLSDPLNSLGKRPSRPLKRKPQKIGTVRPQRNYGFRSTDPDAPEPRRPRRRRPTEPKRPKPDLTLPKRPRQPKRPKPNTNLPSRPKWITKPYPKRERNYKTMKGI
jgi:hypothetical protein